MIYFLSLRVTGIEYGCDSVSELGQLQEDRIGGLSCFELVSLLFVLIFLFFYSFGDLLSTVFRPVLYTVFFLQLQCKKFNA